MPDGTGGPDNTVIGDPAVPGGDASVPSVNDPSLLHFDTTLDAQLALIGDNPPVISTNSYVVIGGELALVFRPEGAPKTDIPGFLNPDTLANIND